MVTPPPYEDESIGITHATRAVQNQPDRYAIVDIYTGQTHGYIEHGNPPIAFTETLHTSLKNLLNTDNTIGVNDTPNSTDQPPSTTYVLSPDDGKEYIQHVIISIPLPFVVPKADTAKRQSLHDM